MKKLIIIFCFLNGVGLALSQEQVNKIQVSVYANHFIHPGGKIGLEHQLKSQVIEKQKKRKLKIKTREIFVQPALTVYSHSRAYSAINPAIEFGYRKIRKKGFKLEALIGSGYMRTFYPGTTYKVDNNGDVNAVRLGGRNYVTQTFILGIGHDLRAMDLPVAWHLRPNITLQIPYNTFTLPQVNIETGITWQLNYQKKQP